jgi:hypothetical protein
MTTKRIEHDLGDRHVPEEAYYGVHTLRAVENFPITGIAISVYPELIKALAAIKQAAALANMELGLLDETRGWAIVSACEAVRAGRLHDQFVVDVIQGGAGTSTNMNANEVIANLALEGLGHAKGDYGRLHPNEHVNMSQSTNDVYPTALKVATYHGVHHLIDAMEVLRLTFARKAEEFRDGRGHVAAEQPDQLSGHIREAGGRALLFQDAGALVFEERLDHRPSVGLDGIGGRPPVMQVAVGMRVRLERSVAPDLQEDLLLRPSGRDAAASRQGLTPEGRRIASPAVIRQPIERALTRNTRPR